MLAEALRPVLEEAKMSTSKVKQAAKSFARIRPDLIVFGGSVEELEHLRKTDAGFAASPMVVVRSGPGEAINASTSKVALIRKPFDYDELIEALKSMGIDAGSTRTAGETDDVAATCGSLLEDHLEAIFSHVTQQRGSEDGFELIENRLLKIALEKTDGNQSRAAKLLGITRNTVRKRAIKLSKDPLDR